MLCWRMLTYSDVCWRMLTYADVCWRIRRRDLLYTTPIYVSSCCYIYVSAYWCAVPRLERNTFCAAAPYDAYICVLMLLYMCPHAAINVSAYCAVPRLEQLLRCCAIRRQVGRYRNGRWAHVCWRMLTYADVCWRMLTYADVCWRMLALLRHTTWVAIEMGGDRHRFSEVPH
jgi:hypothetical protein